MTVENYRKIVNETSLKTASNPLFEGDAMIANPTEEVLHSYGYYIVEDNPMPEPEEGYYWVPNYAVNDDKIVITWSKIEMPAEDLRSEDEA